MKKFLKAIVSICVFVIVSSNSLALEDKLPTELKRLLLQGDYETLHGQLQTLAELGNVEAQYQLGLMFKQGLGVEENAATALHWFELAAKHNNAKAQFHAALMLLSVNNDSDSAMSYLRQASDNGHKMATKRLAAMTKSASALSAVDKRKSNEKLLYSAKHGLDEQLRASLVTANPNFQNSLGQTALHLAIENGNTDLLSSLLRAGAKPDIADASGNTAIHYAAIYDETSLLANPMNSSLLNRLNREGKSALLLATLLGRDEIAIQLLRAGASIKFSGTDDSTLIEIAASKNREKIIEEMNRLGVADTSAPREKDMSVLLAAIEQQLRQPIYREWDALMYAGWSGDVDMINWLIERPSLERPKSGWKISQALLQALKRNKVEAALLLSKVAVKHALDDAYMEQALQVAIANDAVEILKELSASNTRSQRNELMWMAADNGAEKISKVLLDIGVDLKFKGADGSSYLQAASKSGMFKIMHLLIADDETLNAVDDGGRTSLWYAADRGRLEAQKLLIGAGAKLDTQDINGHTALLRAVLGNRPEIVKELLTSGANPNLSSNSGNTALIAASEKSDPEVVSDLLEFGAQVNGRNLNSLTALMVAVTRGNEQIVSMLLAAGADPSRKSRVGKNAIAMANSHSMKALVSSYD